MCSEATNRRCQGSCRTNHGEQRHERDDRVVTSAMTGSTTGLVHQSRRTRAVKNNAQHAQEVSRRGNRAENAVMNSGRRQCVCACAEAGRSFGNDKTIQQIVAGRVDDVEQHDKYGYP